MTEQSNPEVTEAELAELDRELENDPISSAIDAAIEDAVNRRLPGGLRRLGSITDGQESD
jgi:hypothetical protein